MFAPASGGCDEEFQNGRGIGRIDAGGMVAFLNHPDVVVV